MDIEVEKALTSVIEADLSKAQLDQHAAFVTSHLKSHLLRGVDYMAYGMSDELELPPLDMPICDAIFAYHDPKVRETLIDILKDLFSVIDNMATRVGAEELQCGKGQYSSLTLMRFYDRHL